MITHRIWFAVALIGTLALASCSGSSGSSSTSGQFELVLISIDPNATVKLNQEIEFTFSEAVDFRYVNANTMRIETRDQVAAVGDRSMKMLDTDGDGLGDTPDPKTVVFRPRCPILAAPFADAGLIFGGTVYDITVAGTSSGAQNTVRSSTGKALRTTQRLSFTTPQSASPSDVFANSVSGPPIPLIRPTGSVDESTSYIEIGGDDDNRVYFEFDGVSYALDPTATFEEPLNLYSDEASKVRVVLEFNQPVSTTAVNISSDRLRLEFKDAGGVWRELDTRVELIANCTETGGGRVSLEPIGILPESSEIRFNVRAGFEDLGGADPVGSDLTYFGTVPTRSINFTGLSTPDDGGDELLEEFDVAGGGPDSFEDTSVLFDTTAASWGSVEDGALLAGFTFDGTGGPGGAFDVTIPNNADVLFDTTQATLTGVVGGSTGTSVTVVGGVIDVRNFIIEDRARFTVNGPNPLVINATGDVIIRGILDANGGPAPNVATLNTGNVPATPGIGQAGGGDGGRASTVLTTSTPRGERGFTNFNEVRLGGEGGESGYAPKTIGKNQRRPGGGGGGTFIAAQTRWRWDAGFDAADPDYSSTWQSGAGNNGYDPANYGGTGVGCTGAESGVVPAAGGAPGPVTYFVDGDDTNDFFGVHPSIDPITQQLDELVYGELTGLRAGAGGGGGGDALMSNAYPPPNWGPGRDEKGGGGGGGGGAVHIRALGSIVFGLNGQILSNGGRGAKGENTNFLDHVGGSGGGGSGGHVVLESATAIDFTDGGANDAEPYGAGSSSTHESDFGWDFIRTLGAAGGAGNPDSTNRESKGGVGGPGIIQLHVPDAVTQPGRHPSTGAGNGSDIYVPAEVYDRFVSPNELAVDGILSPTSAVTSPPAIIMVPSFGARSRAQSKWIPIGQADQRATGGLDRVEFMFEGIETAAGPDEGKILETAGVVDELAPILGGAAADVVSVGGGGDATVMNLEPHTLYLGNTGGTLDALISDVGTPSKDIYLRTPELLEHFILRLSSVATPTSYEDFRVTEASFVDAGLAADVVLSLMVDTSGDSLLDYVVDLQGAGDDAFFSLIPRYFLVSVEGVADSVPANSFVKIRFEATGVDAFGDPDENNILVPFTGDISQFNLQPAGAIKFFRFDVEFDLDSGGTGLTVDTAPISLEFLRIPFGF